MITLDLLPGQTVAIEAVALACGTTRLTFVPSMLKQASPVIDADRRRPGPLMWGKSDKKSKDFHAPILEVLKGRALNGEEIREVLGTDEDDINTVAWALVELQNEGCKRGKNRPQTGPITKLSDGRYALAA